MHIKSFEIISAITYGVSKLVPKKKNRWIFGAWFGNAVSDNTIYKVDESSKLLVPCD